MRTLFWGMRIATQPGLIILSMMSRDPFNPADIQAEETNRREDNERYMRRVRRAIAYVMDTPEGREAMEIILDATGVLRPSFSTNALSMAHNEGRRSVGLSLMQLIEPGSYQKMLRESYERRSNHRG